MEYSYNANSAYFDGIQLFNERLGTEYKYNAYGDVLEEIDVLGLKTAYDYDGVDLTWYEPPVGSAMQYRYDTRHNVIKATEIISSTEVIETTYCYDTFGNVEQITSTNGSLSSTTEATYTSNGNQLTSVTDAAGKVTTYSYDDQTGVLEWVQEPKDSETTRTEYTYDSMYRMVGVSDGLVTSSTAEMQVEYAYSDDLLTSIVKPYTTYTLTYGIFNRLSSLSIGTRTLATYSYVGSGDNSLKKLAYGNGDVVEYTYDDLGRVIQEDYCENGSTTVYRSVSYKYDSSDSLASMKDSRSGITVLYEYDNLGRVTRRTESGSDPFHSIQYEYDGAGNVWKTIETIGTTSCTTYYGYDEQNRVEAVQSLTKKPSYSFNSLIEYEYDDFDRRTGKTLTIDSGELLTETITYRKPTSTTTTNQVATYKTQTDGYGVTYTYTYDNNGNIASVSDGTYTTTYSYDGANQLVRENNQKEGKTWYWSYNSAGNLWTKKEFAYTTGALGTPTDTISYGYGSTIWGDLLTSYDGTTITYDTIGNPLGDGTWAYTWAQGRQLASMTSGSTTWSFSYDANGLRTGRNTSSTEYDYVYNESGQLTQIKYESLILNLAYDAEGRPVSISYNSKIYYFVLNLQGDVVALVDSSGNQVVGYTYDAWGKPLSITGSMKSTLGQYNPLRYRSYVYDRETGLYYLQSRYYNPTIGRFINADNQLSGVGGDVLGYNLFAYCGNNPVSMYDPTGEIGITTLILIGSAIFGAACAAYTAYMKYEAGCDTMQIISDSICAGITGFCVVYTGGMSLYQCYQNYCYLNAITPVTDIGFSSTTPAITSGPYSNLPDPSNVAPGKPFTAAQKSQIIQQNKMMNGGVVKSDLSGVELIPPQKSMKGVTPSPLEWQIDHIIPKSAGGTNSFSNAQVLSRIENRLKWDN